MITLPTRFNGTFWIWNLSPVLLVTGGAIQRIDSGRVFRLDGEDHTYGSCSVDLPNARSVCVTYKHCLIPGTIPHTHHTRGRRDSVWGSFLAASPLHSPRYLHLQGRECLSAIMQQGSSIHSLKHMGHGSGPSLPSAPLNRGGFGSEGENRARATIIALALSRSLSSPPLPFSGYRFARTVQGNTSDSSSPTLKGLDQFFSRE